MRAVLVALALAVTAAASSDARAQTPPPPAAAAPAPTPEPGAPLTERRMRQPEQLTARPSGFWTSNRPAKGGAYRYRMLLLGVAIVLLTGLLMVRLVRRHARPAA